MPLDGTRGRSKPRDTEFSSRDEESLLRSLWLILTVALVLPACQEGCVEKAEEPDSQPDPPAEGPATGGPRLRTIYVPAYSHLPRGKQNEQRSLLSVLLSVRNVDATSVITLTHVDYFDTSGRRVRRYLAKPRKLRPLETAEFSVDTFDESGGSGANFLINWEGPSDAHPLLTETVMLGHMGIGFVAFTSRGIELERRPDPSTFVRRDYGATAADAGKQPPQPTSKP